MIICSGGASGASGARGETGRLQNDALRELGGVPEKLASRLFFRGPKILWSGRKNFFPSGLGNIPIAPSVI